MSKVSYRKLSFFTFDMFIIFLFVFCVNQAYHSWDKQYITFNKSQQVWYDTNKTLSEFHVSYNITAETFSAHPNSTITISAIGFIDDNFEKKFPINSTNTDHFYVFLPDAIPTTNVSYSKGHILQEVMTLQRDTSHNLDGKPMAGDLFRGSASIYYGNEGDKCTFVSTIYSSDTSDCPKDSDIIIHVSPPDSYFQLQNSRVTNELTYILIAFTVLSLRVFANDFVDNLLKP